jgi:hypothetical protein
MSSGVGTAHSVKRLGYCLQNRGIIPKYGQHEKFLWGPPIPGPVGFVLSCFRRQRGQSVKLHLMLKLRIDGAIYIRPSIWFMAWSLINHRKKCTYFGACTSTATQLLLHVCLSFCLSVCLSARPSGSKEQKPPLDGVSWSFVWGTFTKVSRKIHVSLKLRKNKRKFAWRPV